MIEAYGKQYPKAIETLEEGIEDSLTYYDFESLDARKVSSNNMLERLNKEIRRRTRVIGIFPNPESYVRLVIISSQELHLDNMNRRPSFDKAGPSRAGADQGWALITTS